MLWGYAMNLWQQIKKGFFDSIRIKGKAGRHRNLSGWEILFAFGFVAVILLLVVVLAHLGLIRSG
jgi:hypothetical protein